MTAEHIKRSKWERAPIAGPNGLTRQHVPGTSPYDGWAIRDEYWPNERAIVWLTSPADFRYIRELWIPASFDFRDAIDPFGTFHNCQILGFAELKSYSHFVGLRCWYLYHGIEGDGQVIPPVDEIPQGGFIVPIDPENFGIVAGVRSVSGYSRRDLTDANLAAAAANHSAALAAFAERRERRERAIKARAEWLQRSEQRSRDNPD